MTLKSEVIHSLDSLPGKAGYMEMQYLLYVTNKIHQGEASLKSKGGVSHRDVSKRLKKWLTK